MKTINYKSLKGEDLLTYFLQDHPDKDYSSTVALLPVATSGDMEDAYKLLERSIDERKQFIAVYPGDGQEVSGMEYIGEINDGALYLFFNGKCISQ